MSVWINVSNVQVRLTSGKLIVNKNRECFKRFMWVKCNQVVKVNITFAPTWDTVWGRFLHHTVSWSKTHTDDGSIIWTSMNYNDQNAVMLETAMKTGLAPWTPETLEKIHQYQIRHMSHEDFVENYC